MFEFMKPVSEQIKMKSKDIVNYHFEQMEWNIQTTMYSMLVELLSELEGSHLNDIAAIYKKNGNTEDIDAQLKDAIKQVLLNKNLIKD